VSTVAPYGSWRSPIAPSMVARAGIGLMAPQPSGDDVLWLEGRPTEGGRFVLVRRTPDGSESDITPTGYNLRTRVHEYGGIPFVIRDGQVYFSNFQDQRLYRQPLNEGEPEPITPEPPEPAAHRYADLEFTPDGSVLLAVRERHESDGTVVNELVALSPDGSKQPRLLVQGNDFYSSPRVSPDGGRLAWTTWNHPNMPWDGTELWVADLAPDGEIANASLVAGGESESIYQPAWSPDGRLHFVSDRTGWWNLYREGEAEPLIRMEAEFGVAQWMLGTSTNAFLDRDRIACMYAAEGFGYLAVLDVTAGTLHDFDLPFTAFGVPTLRAEGRRLFFMAASPTQAPAAIELNADTGEVQVLKRSMEVDLGPAYISIPRAIDFPTEDGTVAHAIFYPPTNPDHHGPPDQLPPLVVESHGGPTGRTVPVLALGIQFWTSRGFAVVDVNYRGSTGYGRPYRDALKGAWGVADVEDCIKAARYLADSAEADPQRLCIRGGSAGGYTTLCALTFRDEFHAGASYFGIGDLETMVRDTHKFESRYLDSLIGPYPDAKELYRERSPIHHLDRFSTPVIILQGLEDEVVPPNQAEEMVKALRDRGIPFAYLAFEGEQHGFRKAENIERSHEAELYFYSKVLGFELPDPVEPVEIENL
jgi:dipeptidyl aminopeptidase/acylaminoacyl peptidase